MGFDSPPAHVISDADRLTVEWLPTDAIEPGDDQAPPDLAQVEFYVRIMGPGGHVAPPMVSPAGPGRWRLRDGKHRWHAHRRLGRERVRCVVVVPG